MERGDLAPPLLVADPEGLAEGFARPPPRSVPRWLGTCWLASLRPPIRSEVGPPRYPWCWGLLPGTAPWPTGLARPIVSGPLRQAWPALRQPGPTRTRPSMMA